MFRSRDFLIEKGLYSGCREDTFYIIGSIYDEVCQNHCFDYEKIEELRNHLDQHRELINNATYSIIETKSVIKRFRESFKEEKIFSWINLSCFVKDKSIKNNYKEWQKKTGIYGIFIDDLLVYIGSTKKSFQYRFTAHKNAVYGEATQYIHKQIKIALEMNKKIEFKPLIVIEDLSIKYDRKISEDELKCMELALISVLQPIYNIEGVLQPFSF